MKSIHQKMHIEYCFDQYVVLNLTYILHASFAASMKTCTESLLPMEAAVRDALMQVMDPEVGENIVDLGLVYGIEVNGNVVKIAFTMTSPACPMGEMILDDIHATLIERLPKDMEIHIDLVWQPPWNPGMISAAARQRLGWA
jgi:metal-sulfur cluster biosynthetic enzyme